MRAHPDCSPPHSCSRFLSFSSVLLHSCPRFLVFFFNRSPTAGQINRLQQVNMASSSSESAPFCLTPLDNVIEAPYVDMALFFPASSPDVSSLVQNMTSALAQTFNAMPLLASTVTLLPDTLQRGRLAVTASWRTAEDALMVKDLRETDYPSYEALRSKQFPRRDLNYSILLPTERSMHIPRVKPLEWDERPVLLAQINLIKGGMILGFIIDHAFVDGAGSVTISRVWAAYCRGEDGSQLVSPDILDRTQLLEGDESAKLEDFKEYFYYPVPNVPASTLGFLSRVFRNLRLWVAPSFRSLFDFGLNVMDHLRAILQAGPAGDTSRSEPNPMTGQIFFFSKAKLRGLKEMASRLEIDEKSWISTNDALASLLWCCITAAHKTDFYKNLESNRDKNSSVNLNANNESSLLGFVMDSRRLLRPPMPAGSIGNVLTWGAIIEPFNTVVPTAEGVTECAHSLRRKMKRFDDAYLPRLIGALMSVPDIQGARWSKPSVQRPELVLCLRQRFKVFKFKNLILNLKTRNLKYYQKCD